MRELCVDVRGLSKRFGEVLAIDEVSLTIESGTSFALYGPAGSGKSTLMRMLLGIVPLSSGQGTVLGFDLATQSALIRSRVGYMSQKFSLYEDLSVVENMRFFAGVLGLSRGLAEARVETLLELCRLTGSESSVAFHLSACVRQRLAFAVSLIHDPDLIFLDEPGNMADSSLRRCFGDQITALSQVGKTVVVTTQSLPEAERCEIVGLLDGGRLLATGTPEQLRSRLQPTSAADQPLPSLEEVFSFLQSQS